jgi:hypothetical protein
MLFQEVIAVFCHIFTKHMHAYIHTCSRGKVERDMFGPPAGQTAEDMFGPLARQTAEDMFGPPAGQTAEDIFGPLQARLQKIC